MTARDTITLKWRPAGLPARRHDDFAEIPYVEPQPKRRGEPAPLDLAEIDQRLQNWGRWNIAKERHINRSATAAFCDKLRRDAGVFEAQSDERRRIDDEDAYNIERGLDPLRGTQKQILRMYYVEGRVWQVICRVLQFAVRRDLFDTMLANAQESLQIAVKAGEQHSKAKVLDIRKSQRYIPSNN